MNRNRFFLAALAGGIAMYFWAALAHMALPLATVGIGEVANDQALLVAMRTAIGERSGLYMFPSSGWRPGDSAAQRQDSMKIYDARLHTEPSGILIYHSPGAQALTPGQLLTEFVAEMIEAALAIWLLTRTQITNVAGRIGFVSIAGFLATLPTNLSYWNWYGFPGSYTVSYMFTEFFGFVIAGAVAAFILPRRAAT